MNLLRRWSILIFIDLLLVVGVFGIFDWYIKFPNTWVLVVTALLWLAIGILCGKFEITRFRKTRYTVITVILVNIIAALLVSIFYVFTDMKIGVWGKYVFVMGVLTLLEIYFCLEVRAFVMCKQPFQPEEEIEIYRKQSEYAAQMLSKEQSPDLKKLFRLIREQSIRDPFSWKEEHEKVFSNGTKLVALQCEEGLEGISSGKVDMLVNLIQLNKVRHVNRFFVKANTLLDTGGFFVVCCQTGDIRKWKILRTYPKGLNYVIYFFDYLWNRVCPKLPGLVKRFYFWVTRGQHRVFPRTEILGRLYCSGFEVKQEEYIHGLFYVIAVKVKKPFENPPPRYGLLIRLKRIGKDGNMIGVYKFRTMYAYAEYLQPYVYQYNRLQDGGKFANDYRISSVGRLMRKFWLDELPMVINLIKGNMKLVGVRPLSLHYYSLYDKDLQEMRIKTKPGLLPPFYVDMPKTLDEIQTSERKYLNDYFRHPRRTDWKYFWKILYSIIVKQNRSA